MSEKVFKILGISSGRVMGNAEVALRETLMECEKLANVDVRIARLRNLKITECNGCMECMKDAAAGGNGACPIKDDFDWLKEQILWADAIVFSDPCFCYIPTSEVITMLNRALGVGKDYEDACRKNPKYVALICVGGSDTVDFSLPMQYEAMFRACPGMILVDQFYADWIRGKGFIADQPIHMDRARLMAKRLINKLNGYDVPDIKTRILKLNPMEYNDDLYVDLEDCPVCHQAVVEMNPLPFFNGQFTCAVCGARGRVEYHGGNMTYVWDDDSVAHNRLHPEFRQRYIDSFVRAHAEKEGTKEEVPEFPYLIPGQELPATKPRIIAICAGQKGGTSELLARKALQAATADGKFEGALINIFDVDIHFCIGCLACKCMARYEGKEDECVIKDEFFWFIDRLNESAGYIWSVDSSNGFVYGRVVSVCQRFGHGAARFKADHKIPNATMISSFDEEVVASTYIPVQMERMLSGDSPVMAREEFTNVSLIGDNILYDKAALGRAAKVGAMIKDAAMSIQFAPNVPIPSPAKFMGMCACCGLKLIELHPDMTVSCSVCDAHGKFEHRFGENVIVWDDYSVTHSRYTPYGGMLHFKHINYSQSEDYAALKDPNVTKELLAPYKEYGKVVKPQ